MKENTSSSRSDNEIFENEIRRIARHRWPIAEYAGATKIDERERDGVFETEDCIHILEVTVSRQMGKAKDDIKKIVQLSRTLQTKNPMKAIKGWFVTRDEPTADQRDVAKPHGHLVSVLSASQFQSALVDVGSYLAHRKNYPFGSVRDPQTGGIATGIPYIPLDVLEAKTSDIWSVEKISNAIASSSRFALFGDYGGGKSMTLREIYKTLSDNYTFNRSRKFPIYLNLRDHIGQINTAEIIERHARNVGFENPSHLVRAWRAGYVYLILDGFDEISTLGINGIWRQLKDLKFQSMQAIRELIRETPSESGIILAGRSHFFGGDLEAIRCLGISTFLRLTLNEFTNEQILKYLSACGLPPIVPNWLPTKPLLVGYLATKDILTPLLTSAGNSIVNPAIGWDLLLDQVCQREADMELGLDSLTIRRILERLGSYTRTTSTGLGPITWDKLEEAFFEVCGYKPDDRSRMVVLRLPGLGVEREDEFTKSFIDEDFADICRVGDVVRFISDPYSKPAFGLVEGEFGLGVRGLELLQLKTKDSFTNKSLEAAIQKIKEILNGSALLVDLVLLALINKFTLKSAINIEGAAIPEIILFNGMGDFSNVSFIDSYIYKIELDPAVNSDLLPRFISSFIFEFEGRNSIKDLPKSVFDPDCVIETFSDVANNTNAITQLDLPLGVIVLLTVLRKLYIQSGSGRLESALFRGLGQDARRLVPDVLRLLESSGLAIKYVRGGLSELIWRPDRSQKPRVMEILQSPNLTVDQVVQKARSI